MLFKKVTHVIFDMDGLLLESESAYDRVISEIVEKFDKRHNLDLKIKLLGLPENEAAKIVIKELSLPLTEEEFLQLYRRKVNEILKHPPLMPGAKELVEHLHRHNIPIAVATSSFQDSMELKTQHHKDLFIRFHHIVCGTSDPDVKRGKPAPDIFLVCASKFPDKPHPDQCLVLEDAPNGTQGAITAGMQAILVPDPEVPDEKRKPATLVLPSLKHFKPELFGLPAFE